jgi:hypothetical protein
MDLHKPRGESKAPVGSPIGAPKDLPTRNASTDPLVARGVAQANSSLVNDPDNAIRLDEQCVLG